MAISFSVMFHNIQENPECATGWGREGGRKDTTSIIKLPDSSSGS